MIIPEGVIINYGVDFASFPWYLGVQPAILTHSYMCINIVGSLECAVDESNCSM